MSWLCMVFGHRDREITGFRNEDGAPILLCKRCGPIVWPKYQASKHIMQDLYGDGPWNQGENEEK